MEVTTLVGLTICIVCCHLHWNVNLTYNTLSNLPMLSPPLKCKPAYGRFDYMYCMLVYISMEVTTLVGLTICIVYWFTFQWRWQHW
jgi:hypothetical protein